MKKRHFYNGEHYQIDDTTNTVKLLPRFHEQLKRNQLWNKFGFKRVGGSTVGDVLELNQFKSQFVAFCRIAWIGMPILDFKYIDAGNAIEPIVISYLREKTGRTIEAFRAEDFDYNYFAGADDVLGGVPDGFIEETDTVIEVKTTGEKNLEKWNKYGVPEDYKRQAQLYAYLMKAKKYSIVAAFLKEEDYAQPQNLPINSRKVKNWNFTVDEDEVKNDIFLVKYWYKHVTESGESPRFDNSKHADLLDWLRVSSVDEQRALEERWRKLGKIK